MTSAPVSLDDIHVQVINLDRDTGRLERTGQALDSAGVAWTRLPANAPTPEEVVRVPNYNRDRRHYLLGKDMSPGQMGCFQSHLAALEAFLRTDRPYALVLEDDVTVTAGRVALMLDVMTHLRGQKWDCINLTAAQHLRQRHVAQMGDHALKRSFQFPLLTSGLVWHRESARAFLDWTQEVGIYTAVDAQLRDWLSLGPRGYSLQPPLLELRDEGSNIQVRKPGPRQRTNRLGRFERRQKLPLYARTIWRWALNR